LSDEEVLPLLVGEEMKALVTGSNGFVGSHLAEELVSQGYEVTCLVRRTSNLRWLSGLPIKRAYGDMTSEESLFGAVRGKDIVYHTAGVLKARSQWGFDRVNRGGTANLLKACWKVNPSVRRFVLISSLAAGGPSEDGRPTVESAAARPVSRYGESKLKGEEEARRYLGRLPITILRPPAIFGPRDYGMHPFFKMLKRGIAVLVSGERRTNFVYVKDVVAGAILAATSEAGVGGTYHIGAERGCSWGEFAKAAAGVMGKRLRRILVPPAVVRAVGGVNSLAGALAGRAMMLDWQKANEILQPYWLCDISKAKVELGYRPRYSLEDGLRDTIGWYEKEGWI
jgi:dihydroflavonol-4-reductase